MRPMFWSVPKIMAPWWSTGRKACETPTRRRSWPGFPNCVPPTLISRSLEEMRAFIDEHEQVVVKPLDLMGGRSVFVTDAEDGNRNVILETVTHDGTRYVMVQKYLARDRRFGRQTNHPDRRSADSHGPGPHPVPRRSPRQYGRRCADRSPAAHGSRHVDLRANWPGASRKGLLFTGIDVIGDFMTELNVTSPTGIRELERESDVRIAKQMFDAISSKLE